MGLGWKIAPIAGNEWMVWHDGGPVEGIGALIAFLPEQKLGVALIANSTSFEGSLVFPVARELLELMLETKYDIIKQEDEAPTPVEVDHTVLESYTGRYVAFGDIMEVFLRGSRLKAKIMGFPLTLTPLSETTFQPNHWLLDLGVGKLINLPMDIRDLRLEFFDEDEPAEDMIIVNFDDVVYETWPRYPDIEEQLENWEKITGEYNLYPILPSGATGENAVGSTQITIEDGIMRMSGFVGPILPISETELIILSGSFAWETILYEPETGYLFHQKIAFIKASNSE
jgi:hypothetical protein